MPQFILIRYDLLTIKDLNIDYLEMLEDLKSVRQPRPEISTYFTVQVCLKTRLQTRLRTRLLLVRSDSR